MSEDESRRIGQQDEKTDEVEAHTRRADANEEADDDATKDDEVEGHSRRVG